MFEFTGGIKSLCPGVKFFERWNEFLLFEAKSRSCSWLRRRSISSSFMDSKRFRTFLGGLGVVVVSAAAAVRPACSALEAALPVASVSFFTFRWAFYVKLKFKKSTVSKKKTAQSEEITCLSLWPGSKPWILESMGPLFLFHSEQKRRSFRWNNVFEFMAGIKTTYPGVQCVIKSTVSKKNGMMIKSLFEFMARNEALDPGAH